MLMYSFRCIYLPLGE